ncbi:hypothetical protein BU24DRAFT_424334 [Aaosphaeria arxii CBS 175.79]|uniref:Uncharacterized protein n=1 Tax=Aaosphaeria arxii CBS 175.79 TaxID=1450172 RepID=A0A6A5XKE4_9PLEO|nr:uncharacterized protein BU24DRAFT_424334 [Aaosphaeria arxii CBS 175.79]KAF2013321.1 hypothetical protein BU24DRAFT_424334 [Aaosphaeria arxii CBS 175.79]
MRIEKDDGSRPGHCETRRKFPEIKELFQNRQYVSCASLCEHLLTRSTDKLHPVHLAYLNFYLAQCHDSLAREVALRKRRAELDLAEKHYMIALSSITPARLNTLASVEEDSSSPASPESQHGASHSRRASDAVSLNSDHSTSTVATSIMDGDIPPSKSASPSSSRSVRFITADTEEGNPTSTHKQHKRRPAPIFIAQRVQSSSLEEERLSKDMSSFISMLKAHIASVRELKEVSTEPNARWSFYGQRNSIGTRPTSMSANHDQATMEQIRQQRRSVCFRPRFDPMSVRMLCKDALSEL